MCSSCLWPFLVTKIVLQVQETTLDWLVGLASATALHLGPAILPLKAQIVRVLKALFTTQSKVSTLALDISLGRACMQQVLFYDYCMQRVTVWSLLNVMPNEHAFHRNQIR